MTLECQIFIWKALDYARHFSFLVVSKPYIAKSDERSYYQSLHVYVQICDFNPEQPIDLFCKK